MCCKIDENITCTSPLADKIVCQAFHKYNVIIHMVQEIEMLSNQPTTKEKWNYIQL